MAGNDYRLYIGSRNVSSWSLRPWLAMKEAGLAFEEVLITLRQPATRGEILKVSPSGKVPALTTGDLVVWDSLAIAEFLAESHRDRQLWPIDRAARARARSVSAEMHSGFVKMRNSLPMDFTGRAPLDSVDEEVEVEIRRVVKLWRDCRREFGAGGAYLFGHFSIADAMFAPVASRFTTYLSNLNLFGDDGTADDYRAMMMERPAMREWAAGCR